MTIYKTPLDDLLFQLEHGLPYQQIASLPGYEDADFETVKAILSEAAKFFEHEVAPTNHPADKQGSQLVDGKVVVPDCLQGVYQKMVEGGWLSIGAPTKYGGAGFPEVINAAVSEMLQSANLSLGLLPLLTQGVVHALDLYGSDEQKNDYLPKLVSGQWSGTMNLTEPQAGTDLAAVKTRAEREGDHYRITGQKIFITWGDHQEAENIIHLVLARTPDAPEGVKGISMFLVPKFLLDADGNPDARNDIKTVGVEHKLGIHASPTCVLQFGDKGGAEGYLVGEENQGLVYMFAMMNAARLAVGQQGISVSERAYQQAVIYAQERLQGNLPGSPDRVAIIQHPDVKRMLMTMRALTQAGRAMVLEAYAAADIAARHEGAEQRAAANTRVEVMTPLVKGWCTEVAQEVTSLGIQIHGGMGFIEETGAAQHYRDARILAIYEGTNGIQALDFIGRKTLRDKGAGVQALLASIATDTAEAGKVTELGTLASRMNASVRLCEEALSLLAQKPEQATAVAFPFMMLFANTLAASLLLKSAAAATSSPDIPHSQIKREAARFFVEQLLPRNESAIASVRAGAESFQAFTPEADLNVN